MSFLTSIYMEPAWPREINTLDFDTMQVFAVPLSYRYASLPLVEALVGYMQPKSTLC